MQTTKSEAASSPRHDHVLSEATARPWSANKNNHYWEIHGPSEYVRANTVALAIEEIKTPERAAANAALIVKAVNSHEALVKALEQAQSALTLFRSLVNEGGVPRYGVTPGAALNSVIEEDVDPTIRHIDAALAGAK